MDIQFVPGQRWVSNTESELGLGIVVETLNRRVTVSFPAVGQRRTYAMDNAPLSRVRYLVGEKVSNEDGQSLTIVDIQDQGGYLVYSGTDYEGNTGSIEEIDLLSFVQFSRPQDRMFAGQIDKNKNFQLRVETLHHLRTLQQSTSYGLLGPRVQLLPHQLYIATQVAQRYAPRVLLADEVGLGKTIEAGLILHQQLITGRASRVLVIVPESLIHQWLVEMSRRFNFAFTILDEERCKSLEEAGHGNPFESAQCILCAQSWITENENRHEQAISCEWDLLIVDEAHHLSWSESNVSPEYAVVESLAELIPGLLLLTATPEQLGMDGHFARLRLLDPDRYYDLEKFRLEEESYTSTNNLVQQLLAENAAEELMQNAELVHEVKQVLGPEALPNVEEALLPANVKTTLDKLIQDILDRHGTGRVLFRNTRDAVEGFPQRHLHTYALTTAESTDDTPEKSNDYEDDEELIAALLRPETHLGEAWLKLDPRVDWLSEWLLAHRTEKVLVICGLAHTAMALDEHLRMQHALRSAVFHEGLDLIARDRAAAYFADEEDGAQVLICSEIGSEGRNFQFAHHLVLFDLPLNPDLLEQRIGRLDRIGQTQTVQIHVPYHAASAQESLLYWYHQGINAFEQVCSIGQAVYQQFKQRLHNCLLNSNEHDEFDSLAQDTKKTASEMLEKLQQGRNRLLELNSCNPDKATQVVNSVLDATNQLELADYMERMCDQFGVEHQHHSAHSVILQPGDHMHGHSFPGLAEDGLTATYDRAKALVREDMQFHTWEHPMVTGAMDMILSGDFGNVTLCKIKLQALKPGSILLETIFTIYCAAPKALQIYRYLPQTVIRIVVDQNRNDLSKVLTLEHMNRLTERVRANSARDIIKHTRKLINELITHAETTANVQRDVVIKQAVESMRVHQLSEIGRLKALAKVNSNIRQHEIDYMQMTAEQIEEFMLQSQLKLDSIRVSIVSD